MPSALLYARDTCCMTLRRTLRVRAAPRITDFVHNNSINACNVDQTTATRQLRRSRYPPPPTNVNSQRIAHHRLFDITLI